MADQHHGTIETHPLPYSTWFTAGTTFAVSNNFSRLQAQLVDSSIRDRRRKDVLLDREVANADRLRLPALVQLLQARPGLVEYGSVVDDVITISILGFRVVLCPSVSANREQFCVQRVLAVVFRSHRPVNQILPVEKAGQPSFPWDD